VARIFETRCTLCPPKNIPDILLWHSFDAFFVWLSDNEGSWFISYIMMPLVVRQWSWRLNILYLMWSCCWFCTLALPGNPLSRCSAPSFSLASWLTFCLSLLLSHMPTWVIKVCTSSSDCWFTLFMVVAVFHFCHYFYILPAVVAVIQIFPSSSSAITVISWN